MPSHLVRALSVSCVIAVSVSHAFQFSLRPVKTQDEYEAYMNLTGLYNGMLPSSPFYEMWVEMYPQNEYCYTYHKNPFYNPPFSHGAEDYYPEATFSIPYDLNKLCLLTDTWPMDMTPETNATVYMRDTQLTDPPTTVFATFYTSPQVFDALQDCEMFDGQSKWSHKGALLRKVTGNCTRTYAITDPDTKSVLAFEVVVEREVYLDYTNVVQTVFSSYFFVSAAIAALDIMIWGAQGRSEGAVLVHMIGNFFHLVLFGLPLAIIYTLVAATYAIASCKLTLFRLIGLWFCPFGRTVAPVSLDEEDKENKKPFLCFSAFAFGLPMLFLVMLRLPIYVLLIWSEVGKQFFAKLDDILAWSKDPFNKVVVFEPQAAAATGLLANQYPETIKLAGANKARTDSFSSSTPAPKPEATSTDVAVEIGSVKPQVVVDQSSTEEEKKV